MDISIDDVYVQNRQKNIDWHVWHHVASPGHMLMNLVL